MASTTEHSRPDTSQTLRPEGVVLAFDGSPDAERAVPWAVEVARQLDAPLQILTAQYEPDDLLTQATELVVAHGGDQDVERLALMLPPVEALLAAGRTARLLVLGARGHTQVGGLLLGSVSQHVTRHATCPVAVIREQLSPRAREVVVGVDRGPDVDASLAVAFQLAHARGAALVALHGWPPRSGEQVGGRLPPTPDVVTRVEAAKALLQEVCAPWQERYPDVAVTMEAMPVQPARMLVDASMHAGVLVVGSRGRSAFTGMLLGSVSQSVLTSASCPVVVVR